MGLKVWLEPYLSHHKMATVITEECINCGACARECPNQAIYPGGTPWEFEGAQHPALREDIYYIAPEKCTECVGFHEREQCAVLCPVDCCLPDPERPESEQILLERSRRLHPELEFDEDFPSRFKAPRGSLRHEARRGEDIDRPG